MSKQDIESKARKIADNLLPDNELQRRLAYTAAFEALQQQQKEIEGLEADLEIMRKVVNLQTEQALNKEEE